MIQFLRQIYRQRDGASICFAVALGLAATWVALLPLSGSVQQCYLNRFHLRTDGYLGWTLQQLTPAMYNLENTYWFSTAPLDAEGQRDLAAAYFCKLEGRNQIKSQPVDSNGQDASQSTQPMLDMLNHFPTRVMTFVNARGTLKRLGGNGFFYFRSEYRGRRLDSVIEVKRLSERCSEVIRQGVEVE